MKYYQAILALASAAGFDVLEDAERMQTILPDIFQADEELRMENPLMRQALADALSMWKKQMWGGQFAVLFLHPKQTSLSIYDEHKHLVFGYSQSSRGCSSERQERVRTQIMFAIRKSYLLSFSNPTVGRKLHDKHVNTLASHASTDGRNNA